MLQKEIVNDNSSKIDIYISSLITKADHDTNMVLLPSRVDIKGMHRKTGYFRHLHGKSNRENTEYQHHTNNNKNSTGKSNP